MKSISHVVGAGLCLQCGVCESTCPHGVIRMAWHENQGWLPVVNVEHCTECGYCLQACPGIGVDFAGLSDAFIDGSTHDVLLGRFTSCHVGYAQDRDVRWQAASGGIVTALLLAALESGRIDGAIVTRMDPDFPCRAQTYLAQKRQGILGAAGSKYCTAPVGASLRQLLERDGTFAVVGLPCHIHALRKLQTLQPRYQKKVLFSIGLFCARNFLPGALRTLLAKHGVSTADVTSIRYRGDGWPGWFQAGTIKGDTLRVALPTYYNDRFISFKMPRCMLCTDAVGELADISCGDAWLPQYTANDSLGTSIVITRTATGAGVVSGACVRHVSLECLPPGEARRSQLKLLLRKKRQSVARFRLRRLCGKRNPRYQQELLAARPIDYLLVILSLMPYQVYATLKLVRSLIPKGLRSCVSVASLCRGWRPPRTQ